MTKATNVVAYARTRSPRENAFMDLESDINDIERWADLALYASREEMQGIKIARDGSATLITVERLTQLIKDLRKEYYEAYHTA